MNDERVNAFAWARVEELTGRIIYLKKEKRKAGFAYEIQLSEAEEAAKRAEPNLRKQENAWDA